MTETKGLTHETLLDRYAEVAVKVGVGLERGQELVLAAPIEARPLVRLVAKHAYAAGAAFVHTLWHDDETNLARLRHGDEDTLKRDADWLHESVAKILKNGGARLRIDGENPTLNDGIDPDRLKLSIDAYMKAFKPVRDLITGSETNWSIVAYPVPAWARMVFPGCPDAVAMDRLWSQIFNATRVNAGVADPIAAWKAHNATLQARMRMLTDKNLEALHLRGPGTDLVIGLADGHEWRGGQTTAKNGRTGNCNIPTEEVFSTPHMLRINGVVSSTKPLVYNGKVIEGIRVRFVAGRIVEMFAGKEQSVFEKLIGTDQGAASLGEIGLVPHSSPISQSGVLFYETLYDENASIHIANGQSYKKCMVNGTNSSGEDLRKRGANESLVHVDWMIGSAAIDVDAIHKTGLVEPLIRKGEFVISA